MRAVGTRTLSLALVAAALALVPATAEAVTTIGVASPTAANLTNTTSCNGLQCTYLPFRGASPAFVSPVNGTIVRWRIGASSSGGAVTLRVLRPAGGNQFTAVASSTTQTTVAGAVQVFTTNLPIRVGDAIGLDNGNSALIFKPNVTGESFTFHTPFLANGATGAFNNPTNPNDNGLQLQINADIEPATTTSGGGVPGAPVISGLAVRPVLLPLGTRGHISFSLSEAARYTLTFNQLVPGRKRGTRCLPQSRTIRTGVRCTARRRRGTRTGTGHARLNRLFFNGRLAGRALPLGRYELVANAVDSGGRHALTRRTRFTLKPALGRHR
jgi:hypothetical protein